MRISVIHPKELGEAELGRWRAIQELNPSLANPFLAPEFTVAVGRLRPASRVAVLTDGPEIVGFFPFEQRGFAFGAPICAGHNDCQGLVHVPDLDWDPQALLKACGLMVWEFDHLVDGQRGFEPFQRAQVRSPIMDLTTGYDGFTAQLRQGSNRLRDISRKRRKLEREIGELRFVFDEPDPQLLRAVMSWKSAQYLRSGWADRFARQWFVELLDQLLDTRTPRFSGVLSVLYAGDVPVAGHLGIRSKTTLAHWFPSYDSGYQHCSPGLVMHLSLAEGAALAGIDYIDMGPGPESYKQWFSNGSLMLSAGAVVRGSVGRALHRTRRAPEHRLHHILSTNPSLHRSAKRLRGNYLRLASAAHRRYEGEKCKPAN